MPKLSKAQIEACRDQGITRQAAAEKLGVPYAKFINRCAYLNVRGWPAGAAARNQYGHNNPNYSGGLSRGTLARRTKEVVVASGRDLHICERCGFRGDIPLPRHHKDRDKRNNRASNIEVLCVSCHNREHRVECGRDELGRITWQK